MPDQLRGAAARRPPAELYGIRAQHGVDAPALGVYSDGVNVVVDVHGRLVRLRDPDEDHLLMVRCTPAREGGDSMLVDGYLLVDALRTEHPALHAFRTDCEVDCLGGWVDPTRRSRCGTGPARGARVRAPHHPPSREGAEYLDIDIVFGTTEELVVWFEQREPGRPPTAECHPSRGSRHATTSSSSPVRDGASEATARGHLPRP